MSRFWSPIVHNLEPYVAGEQPKGASLIKLNTNENPYGPSPKVLEAIRLATSDTLRLYPDPDACQLQQAIADYYDVDTRQVFIGNGSDEVLAHIFCGLFQHNLPLLFPDITYSFYQVYCKLYQIEYQTIALSEQFAINAQDYKVSNGGIIFPNPNTPTGRLVALADIETLVTIHTDSVVVVDEAYIDFGGESAITLADQYPNLLVTQTLSKSRSLAGMRIGFAIGHPDLIEALLRVKDSFNSYPMSSLAISAGVAALGDQDYFEQTRHQIIASRDYVIKELTALDFKVIPSAANFIFATHPKHDASELAADLRKQGVVVRHFKQDRAKQYLRITIGTASQNQQLLAVMDTLIAHPSFL